MKKYKIPKKTVDLLYETVHTDIMDVRMQVYSLIHETNDMKLKDKVDELFYELLLHTPEKAIEIFEKTNKQVKLGEYLPIVGMMADTPKPQLLPIIDYIKMNRWRK